MKYNVSRSRRNMYHISSKAPDIGLFMNRVQIALKTPKGSPTSSRFQRNMSHLFSKAPDIGLFMNRVQNAPETPK